MRFTDVKFVGWKKIGWAVFEKNCFFFFIFWGPLKFFWPPKPYLASGTSMVWKLKIPSFGEIHPGNLLNHCLDQRILEVWSPSKLGFLMPIWVLEVKKFSGNPKKWKKNCFSQKWSNQFFFQQTNLTLVNLMGTYWTGICLGPSLLVFQLTRRGGGFGFEPRD